MKSLLAPLLVGALLGLVFTVPSVALAVGLGLALLATLWVVGWVLRGVGVI